MAAVGNDNYDVAIIGGGVIGAVVAYYLTRGGARVALIERRLIAQEASWASAGIIAPGGGSGAPDPRLALYDLTQKIYPELIPALQVESGVDIEYVRADEIMVAFDESDMATLDAAGRSCEGRGYRVERLDAQGVRAAEPAVGPAVIGGLAIRAGGTVRAYRLTTAFIRAAERRGLRLMQETPAIDLLRDGNRVTGVRTTAGEVRANTTILAAGAWTRLCGEWIGVKLPTKPVRGQMMAVEQLAPPLRSVLAGGGGYVLPRGDGTVAVGATEEHDLGFDTRVTPAGLAWLGALLTKMLPSTERSRVVATWAGLRPGIEDGSPMLGPVPDWTGLWVSAGHFRSGVQLAPATGTLVAQSVLSGQVDPMLKPFDPGRFSA